jgi:hypothetical protein
MWITTMLETGTSFYVGTKRLVNLVHGATVKCFIEVGAPRKLIREVLHGAWHKAGKEMLKQ